MGVGLYRLWHPVLPEIHTLPSVEWTLDRGVWFGAGRDELDLMLVSIVYWSADGPGCAVRIEWTNDTETCVQFSPQPKGEEPDATAKN
jgi:hypothetical protein